MRRPLTVGSVVFALALLSAFSAVPGSAASSCSAPQGSVFKLSSRDLASPTAAVSCQAVWLAVAVRSRPPAPFLE